MPTINDFLPHSGPLGQWTYVYGTGFINNDTIAYVGGVKCNSVQYYDSTQIAFAIPNGVSGENTIRVVTSEGECTSSDVFTVATPTIPPTITSIEIHPILEYNWIYVNGDGFVYGDTVISYNGHSDTIPASVYSPFSCGFKKQDGDTVTSVKLTTPNGLVEFTV